jgi:hypothetical protein
MTAPSPATRSSSRASRSAAPTRNSTAPGDNSRGGAQRKVSTPKRRRSVRTGTETTTMAYGTYWIIAGSSRTMSRTRSLSQKTGSPVRWACDVENRLSSTSMPGVSVKPSGVSTAIAGTRTPASPPAAESPSSATRYTVLVLGRSLA